MNYVVVLLRPDRSGLLQAFGPYETLDEAEPVLQELALWPALHGQWEVRRLTRYKAGDAQNVVIPPSTGFFGPHDLVPSYVLPMRGMSVQAGLGERVTVSDLPPRGPGAGACPGCVGDGRSTGETATREPCAAAPVRSSHCAPCDADAHDYVIHSPESSPRLPSATEVRAAYHVTDGDFVLFKDNADETVLAIRVDEVGRIERLRTHMILSTSAEELDLIIGALFSYASVARNPQQMRQADACAQRLQKVQAVAHERAAGDLSMPRA